MVAKLFVMSILLIVAGCSSMPSILYRIDVQQGNVVTEEMLEKLKPGMTKSQVLFVLGSPMIIDAFRDNRWDYVYLFREKGNLTEQKRMTLFFDHDTLVNIEYYIANAKTPVKPQSFAEKPVEQKATLEIKETMTKAKDTKPNEKKQMDDDDDDNCDVPSTVSIKP